MDQNLLSELKNVFNQCEDSEFKDELKAPKFFIQRAIHKPRRPYVEKFFYQDGLDAQNGEAKSEARYRSFYERITSDTKEDFPDKKVFERSPKRFTGFNGKYNRGEANHDYALVLYYWFHAYADDFHLYDDEKTDDIPAADKIDNAICVTYPDIRSDLRKIVIKIRKEHNKPAPPGFNKQNNNDIISNQISDDDVSYQDIKRELSELTPEQRQKIVDQIISIGKNGLVSTSFSVSEKEEGYYPVIGEIHGTKEDILLECDGLDYDSEILFTEFSLIFKMKGLSLENPNHTAPSDIGVEYHWQTDKNEWKITFYEVSEKSALRGNLLRFTNGAVFYASVDENHKKPNIDIIRKCSKNHLNVRFIGFRYEHMPRDENKEMFIRELIQKETLKVFSEEEAHITIEENKSHA